jgi:hypothetical protein
LPAAQGAEEEGEEGPGDLSPGEQRAEALMQQAAVAWNAKQDHVAAERLQRAALDAVGTGAPFLGPPPPPPPPLPSSPSSLCCCFGVAAVASLLMLLLLLLRC